MFCFIPNVKAYDVTYDYTNGYVFSFSETNKSFDTKRKIYWDRNWTMNFIFKINSPKYVSNAADY